MKNCTKCFEIKDDQCFTRVKAKGGLLNSWCKDCNNEVTRAWRSKNKETYRARIKEWGEDNPERLKQYSAKYRNKTKESRAEYNAEWYAKNKTHSLTRSKKWREKNKDKASLLGAEWKKLHKDKVTASTVMRNAIKIKATPSWSDKFFIEEAYNLATLRTKATGFKWHVDHIVPLRSKIVCGLHTQDNLQVIPAIYNLSKNNRHWPDMPNEE